MSERRQLLVRHRALDPTAWTALHTLVEGARRGRPTALSRAQLWEFAWEGGPEVGSALANWAESANWFWNPSRDRATWRRTASDPSDLESGAARAEGAVGSEEKGVYLVTFWRGTSEAPDHANAARRALGVELRVRRGQAWWLAAAEGHALEVLEEAGGRPEGGFLVNPHSQDARVYEGELPVPALWQESARGDEA